jgi:hypothetical protein
VTLDSLYPKKCPTVRAGLLAWLASRQACLRGFNQQFFERLSKPIELASCFLFNTVKQSLTGNAALKGSCRFWNQHDDAFKKHPLRSLLVELLRMLVLLHQKAPQRILRTSSTTSHTAPNAQVGSQEPATCLPWPLLVASDDDRRYGYHRFEQNLIEFPSGRCYCQDCARSQPVHRLGSSWNQWLLGQP